MPSSVGVNNIIFVFNADCCWISCQLVPQLAVLAFCCAHLWDSAAGDVLEAGVEALLHKLPVSSL